MDTDSKLTETDLTVVMVPLGHLTIWWDSVYEDTLLVIYILWTLFIVFPYNFKYLWKLEIIHSWMVIVSIYVYEIITNGFGIS